MNTRWSANRWPWAAGLIGLMAGTALLGAEDAGPDRRVFAACMVCHDSKQANKLGPELTGVFGRKAGTAPGFRHSRAMTRSKIVWDEKSLDAFLADPQGTVPGNVMPFPGLPDARQRKALIEFLKTLK